MRWSFTRSSNCKALIGNILVFWIGGRLWEVLAYERSGRTWRFNCIIDMKAEQILFLFLIKSAEGNILQNK